MKTLKIETPKKTTKGINRHSIEALKSTAVIFEKATGQKLPTGVMGGWVLDSALRNELNIKQLSLEQFKKELYNKEAD